MDPVIVELNCPKELSGGWLYWPHWEDEPHTHTHFLGSMTCFDIGKAIPKAHPRRTPSNPWNMASLHGRVARKIVRNLVSRVWQVVWRIQFANFSAPKRAHTHTHEIRLEINTHPPTAQPSDQPPHRHPSAHPPTSCALKSWGKGRLNSDCRTEADGKWKVEGKVYSTTTKCITYRQPDCTSTVLNSSQTHDSPSVTFFRCINLLCSV